MDEWTKDAKYMKYEIRILARRDETNPVKQVNGLGLCRCRLRRQRHHRQGGIAFCVLRVEAVNLELLRGELASGEVSPATGNRLEVGWDAGLYLVERVRAHRD